MRFNLSAARKAGKTDSEIADYLGKEFGFDVAAARGAGKTDAEIAEYLSTNTRPSRDPAADKAAGDRLKARIQPARKSMAPGSLELMQEPAQDGLDPESRAILDEKGFAAASQDVMHEKPKRDAKRAEQRAIFDRKNEEARKGEGRQEARTDSEILNDSQLAVRQGLLGLNAGVSFLADKALGASLPMLPGVSAKRVGAALGLDVGTEGFTTAMLEERDRLGEQKSGFLKQAKGDIEAAEGFAGTMSAIIDNPVAVPDIIFENITSVIPGMATGRLAAGAAGKMATRKAAESGATRAAAVAAGQQAAGRAAAAGGLAGEALHSGGLAGADAEREVKGMDVEKLAEVSGRFRELSTKMSPEQAREQLADEVGLTTAALAGAGTLAGGYVAGKINKLSGLGDPYAEALVKKITARGAAKTVAGEVVQESLQSPAEQIGQNVANVDDSTAWNEDVGKATALGAVGAIGQSAGMTAGGAALNAARGGVDGQIQREAERAASGAEFAAPADAVARDSMRPENAQIQPKRQAVKVSPAARQYADAAMESFKLAAEARSAGDERLAETHEADASINAERARLAGWREPFEVAPGVPAEQELQAKAADSTVRSQEAAAMANEARAMGNAELAAQLEAESVAAAAEARQALDTIKTEHTGLKGIVNRSGLAAGYGLQQDGFASPVQVSNIDIGMPPAAAGLGDAANAPSPTEVPAPAAEDATDAKPASESRAQAVDASQPVADIKTAGDQWLHSRMSYLRGQLQVSRDPDFVAATKAELKAVSGEVNARRAAKMATPQEEKPAAAAEPMTPAADTAPGVNYPNRKLGWSRAKSDPDFPQDTGALANIAMANLQPGDRVRVADGFLTVKTIGEKSVVFTKPDGKTTRYDIDTPRMEQLTRDVEGLITAAQHGAEAGDIMKALERDPAFSRDERGLPQLLDAAATPAPAARGDDRRKVAGKKDPERRTGDRRMRTPDDDAAARYVAEKAGEAGELGLTKDQLAKLAPKARRDAVTGWFDARGEGEKESAIRAAQEYAEAGGTPVFLSMDIANLGGLNEFRNNVQDAANRDYRGIADAVRAELEAIDPDVVLLRTGGDELGAITHDASESDIRKALGRARKAVKAYADANGFGAIPHAKSKEPGFGVGLYGGFYSADPSMEPGRIAELADIDLNIQKQQAKRGADDVTRSEAAPLGAGASDREVGRGDRESVGRARQETEGNDQQGVPGLPRQGGAAEAVAPKKSRSELARERAKLAARINPAADDVLAAIAKLGGLSRQDAEAQGIDPAEFDRRGSGIKRIFTKGGKGFDAMAESLDELGYPVRDEDGRYSANKLLAQVDEALRGKRIMAPQGYERDAMLDAARRAMEEGDSEALDALAPASPDAAGIAGAENGGKFLPQTRSFASLHGELVGAGWLPDQIDAAIEGMTDVGQMLDALADLMNQELPNVDEGGLGAGEALFRADAARQIPERSGGIQRPAAPDQDLAGRNLGQAPEDEIPGFDGRSGADISDLTDEELTRVFNGESPESIRASRQADAQKTAWLTSLAQTLLRHGQTTERDFVSDDGKQYTVKTTVSTGRLTTAQYDGWKKAVGLASSATPINEELLNISISLTGRNVGEGRDYRAIRTEYAPKPDIQADDFSLSTYTEADLAERDRIQQEAEARNDEDETRRTADAASDAFTLSTGTGTAGTQLAPAVRGPARDMFAPSRPQDGIEELRRNLIDLENKIVGMAGMAPGFIEDAMKSRKVSSALKQQRNELRDKLRGLRAAQVPQPASQPMPSDEELALASRHKKIDKSLDLKSDAEIADIFARAGLAGRNFTIDQKRDALKQEHPDDVEPLLGIGAVDAGPSAAAKPEQKPASKTPIIDRHNSLMESVRDGKATPEQFKAAFDALLESKDAVIAELSTKTKAQLLEDGGHWIQMRYRNEAKPDIVKAVYRDLLADFALGESITYGMSSGSYEDAIKAKVDAADAARLAEYARERKASIEEAAAAREAAEKAIEDPKTVEDFQRFIQAKVREGKAKTFNEARMLLTPEQRIRFDELVAESTREDREQRKRALKTQVKAAGQTTDGQIIATKHTRDGYDLFVVQLADRLSKEDYTTVLASAKRLGGWYSSFRGNGATPGFQFKDKASAEAFLKLAGGDTTDAQAQAEQRRDAFEDDRSQTAVERLREMADRLDERADESLAADRKVNTARRARFAASAERAANADKALAKTMRNIADGIESGTVKFIDEVRQKTQVELLRAFVVTAKDNELRAKYPEYGDREKRKGQPPTAETADYAEFPSFTASRSDLASLARQLLEVDGTKKLGKSLLDVADDVSDAYLAFAKKPENLQRLSTFSIRAGEDVRAAVFPSRDTAEQAIKRSGLVGKAIVLPVKRGENRIILSPSEAINQRLWDGESDKRITLKRQFGMELVAAISRRASRSNRLTVPWQFENAAARLNALSRLGIETPAELRSALREFISLQEQAKELDRIKMMEREMVGRRADGLDFFPTPEGVADQMIEAAEIEPEMSVLEPSAGMGHIADRIRAAGAEPDVVEMSGERRELLEAKGFNVVASDFLEIKPRESFTFGDVFRHADGRFGVMRGSSGLGGGRVGFQPLDERGNPDARRSEWVDREDLTGHELRGTESGYDRIIMNPPFSDRRDAEHVRHAFELLRPGGRLVAIMGEGVFFGQDKKAVEFREWLEQVGGTDEKLPEGSFMDPSLPVNTGVSARMVVIDKPAVPGVSYSIGQAAAGMNPAKVERLLRAGAVGKGIAALLDSGKVVVHAYAPEGIDPRAEGWTDRADGSVHLLAPNLSAKSALPVLMHELFHKGMRQIIGTAQHKRLMRELAALYRQYERSPAGTATNAFWRSAMDRVQSAKTPDADRVEEFGAYAITAFESAPRSLRKWVTAFAGQMKAWLLRSYGIQLGGVTPAQLRAVALHALKPEAVAAVSGSGVLYQAAYHGTPYRFDRFTTDAMGSGEGAQAFGWGLYFAGRKEIAEHYRQKLTRADGSGPVRNDSTSLIPRQMDASIADVLKRLDKEILVAESNLESARENPDAFEPGYSDGLEAKLERLRAQRKQTSRNGQLYEVEIPEDDEMLLWDKPLSEQPDKVRQALGGLSIPEKAVAALSVNKPSLVVGGKFDGFGGRIGGEIANGRALYQLLRDGGYGYIKGILGDRDASEALAAIGIKGIKYLDGISRNRPLNEIKREFLDELPEDADFDEVLDLVGSGTFSSSNEAIIKALAANDWLGFDYPAQAISAALSNRLSDFDPTPELVKAVADAQDGSTYNYVIFSDDDVAIRRTFYSLHDQTNTPEFKAWFGDSKVVDSSGRPLVVYHGTPDGRFLEKDGVFKSQKERYGLGSELGVHWFASDERAARTYMDPKRAFDYQNAEPAMVPAYLRMINPLVIDAGGQKWRDAQRHGKTSDVIRQAQDAGHDGIIIRNVRDDYQTGVVKGDKPTDTYAVFDSAQIKSATGNLGTFDSKNRSIYYSKTDTVGDTFKLPPAGWFVTKFFDRFDRIKQVQKAVQEQGGKVTDLSDIYGQEEAYHSRAASFIDRFRRHRVGGLLKRMVRAGVRIEDVGLFLYAQHAPERNAQIAKLYEPGGQLNLDGTDNDRMQDGGSGMTNAEAAEILAEFEAKGLTKKLDTFARELREITADTRKILRESGLETSEAIDAWEAAYKFYVPLAGKDEANNAQSVIVGRGFDVRGGQKRAMGRKDKAKHIIEQIILQHEQAVIRAEKNLVGKRLLQFVKQNPDRKLWEVNPTEQRRYISADGTVEYREQPLRTDRNVVAVRVNGADTFVLLADQGMADAIHNVGTEDVGFLLRALGAVSRFTSKMFTAFSPAFIAVNAIRDMQTALLHGYQVGGAKYARQIMRNIPRAYAELIRDVRDGDSQLVKLYEQSGGRTGMVFMIKDFEEKHQEVMRQMAALKGVSLAEVGQAFEAGYKEGFAAVGRKVRYNKFTNLFRAFLEVVEVVNGVVENGVRLAAFKAAMDDGKPAREAGSIAKNLTVNFNRKGELAPTLGSLYIFFNASVQGTVRMAQALRNRKLQAVAAGMFMASFLLAALQMDADDDDDGRADLEQVPAWQRGRNLIFMGEDGTYGKMPLPLGWNVFSMLGTEAAIMTMSKSREAYAAGAWNMLKGTVEMFNPVGDFTPSVMTPFFQIARNETAFGGPIYPDYKKDGPASQQFYDATEGGVYERATRFANEATGGNEFRSGLVDINPEKLEHVVEFFGGGALRFLTDTVDTVTAAADGGPAQPADKLPIVRAFYGKLRDEYQTSRFYENERKVSAIKDEVEGLQKAQRFDEAGAIMERNPAALGLDAQASATRKVLKAIKSQEQLIRGDESLGEGEKRRQLQELREQRGQVVKPFNAAYEESVRK